MVLNLETCHNDGNAKNTACGRRGARRFAFLPAKVVPESPERLEQIDNHGTCW